MTLRLQVGYVALSLGLVKATSLRSFETSVASGDESTKQTEKPRVKGPTKGVKYKVHEHE